LPTASAVVSDVVDATKHIGTHVMTLWSSKPLELGDINTYKSKFFARVPANEKAKAESLFNIQTVVEAEGITDEFAFITEEISEADFAAKAKELDVQNRIRVDF
ncbi:MAG: homoserine dehydrogenase, partial [Clostridiales bacterium]|nr:homoserine dehydrogenase [Clostridiales bacterium]